MRLTVGFEAPNLSKALMATSLLKSIREQAPHTVLEVTSRSFSRELLANLDLECERRYFSAPTFGDLEPSLIDTQIHWINQREAALGLSLSSDPKPWIELSSEEEKAATQFISERTFWGNDHKPLVIIQPFSRFQKWLLPISFWDKLTQKYQDQVRFWQIGLEADSAIQNCEYYLLCPKKNRHLRNLFGVFSKASFFIGIDSAGQHIARAFDLPSLVMSEGEVSAIQKSPLKTFSSLILG